MGRDHSLVDDLLKVCVEGMYVCRVCVRGEGVGVGGSFVYYLLKVCV